MNITAVFCTCFSDALHYPYRAYHAVFHGPVRTFKHLPGIPVRPFLPPPSIRRRRIFASKDNLQTEALSVRMKSLGDLPNEILCTIIPLLDPPSAVCLTLTSHRNYEAVIQSTKAVTLDDVCPKNYYKSPNLLLSRYSLDTRNLPHYRDPFKVFDYADGFGISREFSNPAYVQLMLSLRAWMAPRFVFCFANVTPGYVPKKGRHVCSACQSERRYLAEHHLHRYAASMTW